MNNFKKHFDLLSIEAKEKIKKIIFEDIFFDNEVEAVPKNFEAEAVPKNFEVEAVPKKKERKRKGKYFPVELHGRHIKNADILMDLYGVNRSYIYKRLGEGQSLKEIFPNPPDSEKVSTLIKKKDSQGNSFYPMH